MKNFKIVDGYVHIIIHAVDDEDVDVSIEELRGADLVIVIWTYTEAGSPRISILKDRYVNKGEYRLAPQRRK